MITLALIGSGKWGWNYIRTIQSIPRCTLPPKNIKTRDYKDLLSRRDINGVIIATPSSTHFSVAKEFLEHGFNVLIEKPLATNLKEAQILQKIAKKSGGIAMVGHIFTYHPAIEEMKKLIKKIGMIQFIMSESMDYGPIRDDVSALWDWAPHDISITIELLDQRPISISAWALNSLRPKTNLYDMCTLKLMFPDNIPVFMQMGWLFPVKKRNVTVVGEKGSIIFNDVGDKKLTYIVNSEKNQQIYPDYSREFPLTRQVLEFVDCIKKKRSPKTNLSKGVEVVRIIEKAEKSIKYGGKEVKIYTKSYFNE